MRSHVGINRCHPGSGISDAMWTSRLDAQDGTHRAAIFCHPMVSLVSFIAENYQGLFYGQKALNFGIAEAGYTLGASDLGYFNSGGMGNIAEQIRIGELHNWSHQSFVADGLGLGGSAVLKKVVVGISAGSMGAINYYGQNPAKLAEVAAFVFILCPYDLRALYATNSAGNRPSIENAWGITYPTPLPAFASPKDNGPALYGKPIRIYWATDDTVNGQAVTEGMVNDMGPNATAISLGALGHTELAIASVNVPELQEWLRDVAPPVV